MSEKVTSSTNFFLFLKKKNLHKVFNKQKNTIDPPIVQQQNQNLYTYLHLKKLVVEGATHSICRDVDVLKKSKKLD